jgi:asparaginyl-tRNA synthetase
MFRVTTLPPNAPVPPSGKRYENDFFGQEASLTVSGQLEAEALALGLGQVYTFGPTFRAENSKTPRHAAEFWMIEPEAAFMDLEGDMALGEGLVRHVTKHILHSCQADIALFDKFVEPGLIQRLTELADKDFVRVPYREAIDILAKSGKKFEFAPKFGLDLQTEHERFLAEDHFHGPVTVYNYPKAIKAFYMRQNEDEETVAAMDLLVPRIGELIGGSQREERLDVLENRILEMMKGGNRDEILAEYWWYLDLRRFGSVPHAGFGLGFERLIMLLTGIANIRDVLPFPRTPGSLEF